MRIAQQEIQWRKEAEQVGLRGRPIKLQDKKFAPLTQAAGILPFSRRRGDTEASRVGSQKPRHNQQAWRVPRSRWRLSQNLGERATWGDQVLVNKAHTLFSKVVLYLKLCIEDNGGRGGVMQGQQFLVLIEARLSNLSYAKVQVIYIIFWPGGLLTF